MQSEHHHPLVAQISDTIPHDQQNARFEYQPTEAVEKLAVEFRHGCIQGQ